MFFFDKLNLGSGFQRYFEIAPALDLEHKRKVFRIRHEVYCEELKFEPERPDRMETDQYDRHSLHCLMSSADEQHRLVGCTRLVLARPEDPDFPLPVESTCAATLDKSLYDPARVDRSRIAEVSRLAVRGQYRRRKGEAQSAALIQDQDFGSPEQPRFPYIPVGLYLSTIALAKRNGIETLLVLTEPRLANHFAKLGVQVRQIGGPVQHRGTRVPSLMDVDKIIRGLRFFMKPLYRTLAEEIERGYREQTIEPWTQG